ncbi:hypothetical protein GCM10007359_09540 [Rothia aerolata]|uniref:Uncharacterized protein n=1 Tax=Rothia aerolata TaxID=1812262 RepID=A0A917IS27_9MICC|nr:hypothetical protein GCM10007359_09540 [Rothia aerolata]
MKPGHQTVPRLHLGEGAYLYNPVNNDRWGETKNFPGSKFPRNARVPKSIDLRRHTHPRIDA